MSYEVAPAHRERLSEKPVKRSLLLTRAVASQDSKRLSYRDPGLGKYTAGGVTVSSSPKCSVVRI